MCIRDSSWTYLLFGAIHGTLLALERVGLERLLMRVGRIVGHLYFWIVIVFTFSLFRAKNLGHAFAFWRSLAGWGAPTGLQMEAVFSKAVLAALIVGAVIALPLYRWVMKRLLVLRWKCSAASRRSFENWSAVLLTFWCLLLLLSVVAHGSMETYNPFVYFRF